MVPAKSKEYNLINMQQELTNPYAREDVPPLDTDRQQPFIMDEPQKEVGPLDHLSDGL